MVGEWRWPAVKDERRPAFRSGLEGSWATGARVNRASDGLTLVT